MDERVAKQWIWLKIAAIALPLPFVYFFLHLKKSYLLGNLGSIEMLSTFSMVTFGLPIGALGVLFLIYRKDKRGITLMKYTAFLSLCWFTLAILPGALLGDDLCSEKGDPQCNPLSIWALLMILPIIFSLRIAIVFAATEKNTT